MNISSVFHIQRILLQIVIVLGTITVSLVALAQNNFPLLAILTALLFVPLLIQSPAWLLMLTIGLFGTDLTLPMLPNSLTLHAFLACGLSVWILIHRLIVQPDSLRHDTYKSSSSFLLLYLAVITIIMVMRGSGIRYLGSEQWGGGKYFLLFIAALFYWTAPRQPLSERQWKIAFLLLTAGSLLPFLAQWIEGKSGGRLELTPYLQGSLGDMQEVEASALQTTLVRIPALSLLGTAIGLGVMVLIPLRFPHVLVSGPLMLGGLALVGLAGYRSHFLIIAGTALLFSFIYRENHSWRKHLFRLLIAAAILFALLRIVAPLLPPLMQRTLSVIPGIGISEAVQQDAAGTVAWRIELWKFSLQLSAPFRWIGRGFLYAPDELPLFDYTTGLLHMYLRHNYHNGPLGLLIDTGIPGLLACTGLFIMALVEGRRWLGEMPSRSVFGRAYRALYAYLVVLVIYFYAIIGDPVTSVIRVLFILALLKITLASHRACHPPPAPPPKTDIPPEAPAP